MKSGGGYTRGGGCTVGYDELRRDAVILEYLTRHGARGACVKVPEGSKFDDSEI